MWKWYRRESLLFLSLFGAVMIYYSAWQGWDGAWAYGPRFLIIGLPYLALPIAFLLSQKREYIRAFLYLFILSSFLEGLGAFAGASAPGRNEPLLFQPLSYALPQILSGNASVFWTQWIGSIVVIPGIVIVFSVVWFFVISTIKHAEREFEAASPKATGISAEVSNES